MACATLGSRPIPHACATFCSFILLIWSCSCAWWRCNLVAAAADDPALQLLSEQRSILATFKQHVVLDPMGVLASWTASSDVCDWTGVACSTAAGSGRQVTALELPRWGLSGTITPLLFNLQSLTHLNLSGNSFEGSFPDVGQAGNGSIGASLVSLDLSVNRLSGALPSSIGTLSMLQTLWLQVNDFWGPIPSALGRCNKLVELKMGLAPDGESQGRLNGTIPDALANCTSLAVLRLSYSDLTGPIPEWLGSSVAKLQILNLASNRLTGTIPASLGNLTGLTILNLIDNQGLEGEVPVQLASCNKLVTLALGMSSSDFGRSGIGGTLTTLYDMVLSNMTFLETLAIAGTQITGAIPQDFFTFKNSAYVNAKLRTLELANNRLTGTIPASLGNLTGMSSPDSEGRNGMDGTLATLYDMVLSNMTLLEMLVIKGTQITGLMTLKDLFLESLVCGLVSANLVWVRPLIWV